MIGFDDDAFGVDVIDHAIALRCYHGARVARSHLLHSGADVWRLGTEQWYRLALHVRTHQRAVRVIVLEERDQRSGHRNQLLRRNVDVLDVFPKCQNELAGFARSVALVDDVACFVEPDVRLSNDVLVFFPRRQVERPRLRLRLAAVLTNLLVCLFENLRAECDRPA